MKKIAGILICIAFAFSFASCSWEIPERVSVKTNASYNFSLGNIEKDLSETLNLSSMIPNEGLPNGAKVYDYWPNKKGDTQAFLMYMPLQEIPINLNEYLEKTDISSSIENISFSKEIEVPTVDFEYALDVDLDKLNDAVCQNFQLAGPIENYSTESFGALLSDFAESVSFEKGYLIIKAYTVSNYADLQSATSVTSLPRTLDTSYNGTVSISSNNKTITGNFTAGVAEINLSAYNGFELKSSNININFTQKPSFTNPLNGDTYPIDYFIATIDTSDKTNRPYQIEKVTNLKNVQVDEPVSVHEEFDALASLEAAGLEECTIGVGQVLLDFALPTEWTGVEVTYSMDFTGGIELSTGTLSTASTYPVSLPLNDKSISAKKLKVDADFNLTLTNATIDFRKKPKIGFESKITKISTVTVKLSDTSLSFSYPENAEDKLPAEVLNIVKSITLNQCGIEGTYTNTLPGDNNKVSLTVFSDFFKIHDSVNTSNGYKFDLESNSENKPLSILGESTTVKLGTNSAAGEKDAFDFNVDVTLPGGAANKITVHDVETGKKYKFAIDLKPVIDWESITIDLNKIITEDFSDTIGTGFNPSTIFDSMDNILGNDFIDSIEFSDAKMYLYLSRPEGIRSLSDLQLSETSKLSFFYGNKPAEGSTDKPTRILAEDKDIKIITNGKKQDGTAVQFGSTVPNIVVEKNTKVDVDGKSYEEEIVVSTATEDPTLEIAFADLLKKPANVDEETFKDSQLCVDYSINLAGVNGTGDLTINKSEVDAESTGSISICAVIDVPLKFSFTQNASIDLQKIMNKDGEENTSDLFGRSDASGFDEIQKYIKVIDSASIYYRLDEFPIKMSDTDGVSINVALGDNSGRGITKTQSLSRGDITITSDEIENLLSAYPLSLKTASIDFAAGNEISIPRKKNINVNLQVGLTTSDESVTLFGN